MKKLQLFLILSCLTLAVVFLRCNNVTAAELKFTSPKLIEETENTYATDLNLDTQGENINLLEASLTYPSKNLELKEILTGDSIINFWIQKPEIQNEKIVFVGSIPAGYLGTNGKVITLIFQPKIAVTTLDINILSDSNNLSRVFLNDSQATEKIIQANHFSFNLPITNQNIPKIDITDVEKPEPFSIDIVESPSLQENSAFVVFNTEDAGSGVVKYEMAQADVSSEFVTNQNLDWKIVKSPVVLNILEAKRFIAIKAIDGDNNQEFSVVDLKPPQNALKLKTLFTVCIILIILIVVAIYAYHCWIRKR